MMNPNDMNIDFLLGLGVSQDGISPAGSSGVKDSGPLFGEMLNDMLMSYPGAVNRPVVDGDVPEFAQYAKQFELPSNPEADKPGEPAVPIDKNILPVDLPSRFPEMQPGSTVELHPKRMLPDVNVDLKPSIPDTPASLDKPILSNVPTVDGVQAVVDKNVSAFNNDIRAQLPSYALPMQNTAIRMNLAVPTNLETGHYEVIESSHANGTIQLKLVDPSARESVIQVSLPADLLSQTSPGSNTEQPISQNSVTRVDLDAMPKQTTNVERLFAQLNLKQIEVSNVAVDSDSTKNHLAIKLSGVRNDIDVQLRAQLPQDQVRAITKQLVQSPGGNTALPKIRKAVYQRSSGQTAEAHDKSTVSPSPQLATTVDNERLLSTFSRSLEQSQSTTGKFVNNIVRQTTAGFETSTFNKDLEAFDLLNGPGGFRTDAKIDGKEVSIRNVRFSLPDDLASKLKPNGQSVMIRIEPDHLGPARLSLRMHQDRLSARITVETVAIKTVVEQSLDRLTQQLIKSGIDVERIEVALDGRQSGGQLSERRPHWQRHLRPTQIDENILTETNEVSSIAPVSTAATAYVGAGGVNVLA